MDSHLIKIDINIAPTPLIDYVRRFVLRQIDEINLGEARTEAMMKHQSFCYDVYQSINEFFIEDWQLSDIYLDEDDYEVKAIVLTRKSVVQNCLYKIAVETDKPYRLLEVGSFGKGPLFKHYDAHRFELATIMRLYALRLRYLDTSYRPTRQIPLTRIVDEGDQVNFIVNHPAIFLKLYGPKPLFEFVKSEIDKSKLAYEVIRPRLQSINPSRYQEYGHQLAKLNPHDWFIESIGVTPTFDIDYILMVHASDLDLRLLLNSEYKVLDVFNDQIVYPDLQSLRNPEFYRSVSNYYHQKLAAKYPKAISEVVAPQKPAILDDDPFLTFRDYFINRKIVVIGPSLISAQDMEKVAYELGLPKGVIDYDNDDYKRIKGTSFDHLKINPGRFLGIVLGPMPHKIMNLGNYASLSSKLREEPGFPFAVEATPLTIGKNLKITKTSLKKALFKIMCHHLDQSDDGFSIQTA